VVEQRDVDRRGARQDRDALAFHEVERDAGVEDGERDDRRAPHEAGKAAGLVPEDVEERVGDQVAVAGPQVGPVAPVEVGAQRLAVGHHHALGLAGRARREHDVARVVGTDRGHARVEVDCGQRGPAGEEVVPADRRAVRLAAEEHGVAQRG
jgi:hypothetical protein